MYEVRLLLNFISYTLCKHQSQHKQKRSIQLLNKYCISRNSSSQPGRVLYKLLPTIILDSGEHIQYRDIERYLEEGDNEI